VGRPPTSTLNISLPITCQLYFVDRRFFPPRHDGRTSFDWYDSFSGARSSQKSIAFEKGSILFNIGVLYAQKGARRNRRTVSGLEASATDFRLSSGVFRFLRDNFQHAPSEDMQAPVVNVLVQLTLSQARECVLQQLLLDRSPGGATDQQNDLLRYVELAQECSTVCLPVFFAIFYFIKHSFFGDTKTVSFQSINQIDIAT